MEILLISGAPSVGKSETIYRLANRLIKKGFEIVEGNIPTNFSDFKVVIEGNNRKGKKIRIIINSPTDTREIIMDFKKFFDDNGEYDILISSIRDDDFWPRQDFFNIMKINESKKIIEIPLAKITRKNNNRQIALNWYKNKMDKLVDLILNNSPFEI